MNFFLLGLAAPKRTADHSVGETGPIQKRNPTFVKAAQGGTDTRTY
jgi:hypothetical protein